jgi:hypothetical protein
MFASNGTVAPPARRALAFFWQLAPSPPDTLCPNGEIPMTFRTSPAPALLTFRDWFTTVDVAPDGSGFPSGTYSEFQPSGIRTRAARGTVEVASFDLTVAVIKRRSWIIPSHASAALLEHERLHFLLAICVGRNLHEDASHWSAGSTAALSAALSQLAREAQQRVQQLSDDYDRETSNGTVAAQQAIWSTRVNRWYSMGFKSW